MFYDQDEERVWTFQDIVAGAHLKLWEREVVEWAGGAARMAVWMACLEYEEEE